jgi:hypothetical protein
MVDPTISKRAPRRAIPAGRLLLFAAADKGTRWIPTQHIKVRQLYVPGLFVKGRSMQLYETVFVQPPETLSLK